MTFPKSSVCSLAGRPLGWAPTSEVRGEGVFLQFTESAIQEWLEKMGSLDGRLLRGPSTMEDGARLDAGRRVSDAALRVAALSGPCLIRQFSLECGYTTASIRERIYSRPAGANQEPMAGILLYTAAPDSEGTLGGLVSLANRRYWAAILTKPGKHPAMCSDPLCAEHHPYRDNLTLHGAACHACLFLPETSCERGNKYLDRSVLVKTVAKDSLAFFQAASDGDSGNEKLDSGATGKVKADDEIDSRTAEIATCAGKLADHPAVSRHATPCGGRRHLPT